MKINTFIAYMYLIRKIIHQGVVLLLFIFIGCVNINSQSVFSVGGGLNNSKFSGDQPTGGWIGLDKGYMFDVGYAYRFNQMISLGTKVNYSSVQAKYNHADTLNEEVDSLQLDLKAISIPVNFIVWTENNRFYFYTGVRGLIPLNLTGVEYDSDTEMDLTSSLRYINIMVHFGVGFIIPIGKPYLFADLCYTQGVSDLNSTFHDPDKSNFPRTKLYSLSFSAGISLPLGGASQYEIKRKKRKHE